MDFFHVWLRRSVPGLSAELESAFSEALGPKWDHESSDGELIDDAGRFGGDKELSKQTYEDGMARSFRSCHAALPRRGGSWSCLRTRIPMPGRPWSPR